MNNKTTSNKRLLLIAIPFLLSALVVITGVLYFNQQKNTIKTKKHDELNAIASLKAKHIINWLNERNSEATFFTQNTPFIDYIKNIVQGIEDTEVYLKAPIEHIMSNNRFTNIFLLSEKGKLLFSFDDSFIQPDTIIKYHANKVFKSGQLANTDFYYCSTHNHIYYDLLAPVISNNKVISVLVFRVNPENNIYPILQDWPTPSKTAESLIVRRDGDSVTFLSPLRHINNQHLSFKLPISQTEVSAVNAVLGFEGLFEGYDYRGVKVLSDIKKIDGTNLFLISEVDQKETYEELEQRGFFIFLIIFLIILTVVVVMIWVYNYMQKNIYQDLYYKKTELYESLELFRLTLNSIGDGVIITDFKGAIKQLNPVAEKLTGWKKAVACETKLEEVFVIMNEKTHELLENIYDKVINDKLIFDFDNDILLISKDGKEIPIVCSGVAMVDENGKVTGVVIVFTDISAERAYIRALEEREDRFVNLFERAPLGYQSLDENGFFIEVNEAWQETLGYGKNEVIGKWFGEFLAPEYVDRFKAFFPIFKKQGSAHSELEMIHKNGERHVIAFVGRIGHKLDGSFEKTHCIIQDITQVKQVEKSLRESESKYRKLHESLTDGFCMVNMDGKFIDFNSTYVQMLGYSVEELKMQGYSDITPSKWHEFESEIVREQILPKGFSNVYEKEYIKKDGTIFPVELRTFLIKNDQGINEGMWAIVRNITDRKLKEKQLLDASNQWYNTFNAINDGIAIIDAHQNILQHNVAFEKYAHGFALPSEHAKCFRSIHKTSCPIEGCPFIKAKSSLNRETMELEIEGRYCEIAVDPMFDEKGNLFGAVHIITDITHRKQAEEELKVLNNNLEKLVEAKTSELKNRIEELERYRVATIDREFRIKELREEVERLKIKFI